MTAQDERAAAERPTIPYPHPECMMPDGADPCGGYHAALEMIARLRQERDDAFADHVRVHKDKCDCLEREMALIQERDAATREAEALRRDLDLHIGMHAVTVGQYEKLRKEAEALREEVERLLAALQEIADIGAPFAVPAPAPPSAADVERARERDGFAAGFAKALEMLTSEKEARERAAAGIVLALNASGSKGDDLIRDAAGSALRAAASALADIAEKDAK